MIFEKILFFIVTILIVVSFHEYGHYLFCRLFGVRVERFSVGFGKVLFKYRDKHLTEWAISAVPLGGYVKPLAEPDELSYERQDALNQKAAWKRFLIYFAGPFFSILLAVFIYSGINLYGRQDIMPILGQPVAHSVAQKAGVRDGDLVLAVNGQTVEGYQQMLQLLIPEVTVGGTVHLKVLHKDGQSEILALQFPIQSGNLNKTTLTQLTGLDLYHPPIEVKKILPGSAQQAGIQVGDQILGIQSYLEQPSIPLGLLVKTIHDHAGKDLMFKIKRGDKTIALKIRPNLDQGQIGVMLQPKYTFTTVRLGLFGAIHEALYQTWTTVQSSLKTVYRMVVGQMSVRNLSGPVSIANYAGQTASLGVLPYLNFVALITISIGVFNLLPIPGLDGGQMLTTLIEIIFRRPLPQPVLQGLFAMGYLLLFALMIYTVTLDLHRILS